MREVRDARQAKRVRLLEIGDDAAVLVAVDEDEPAGPMEAIRRERNRAKRARKELANKRRKKKGSKVR